MRDSTGPIGTIGKEVTANDHDRKHYFKVFNKNEKDR
jgi:hypothetical protein